jgi:segregation and condensation protein B
MMKERSRRKLSVSALESLAVIAYKQPVTKPELEAIRGVNADYVIRSLLERNLITIVGRAATPGRPLLYGTTKEFLKHFGLHDLSDLPKPREIDELLEEAEFEVEKKLIREQDAANRDEDLMEGEGGPRPETGVGPG